MRIGIKRFSSFYALQANILLPYNNNDDHNDHLWCIISHQPSSATLLGLTSIENLNVLCKFVSNLLYLFVIHYVYAHIEGERDREWREEAKKRKKNLHWLWKNIINIIHECEWKCRRECIGMLKDVPYCQAMPCKHAIAVEEATAQKKEQRRWKTKDKNRKHATCKNTLLSIRHVPYLFYFIF